MISKIQSPGRTIISSHYFFRAGLAIGSSIFIERTHGSLDFTNASGLWLLIDVLTIYLLLLIVDQLSIVSEERFGAKLASCGTILSRMFIGLVLPVLPGLVFAMAYFIYIDVSVSQMTAFTFYLLNIIVTLIIFNVKLLCFSPEGDSLTEHSAPSKATFAPGSANNYLDIACIVSENGSCFASNFESDCVHWHKDLVTSLEHLPQEHFYLLNEKLIVNKRAIASIFLANGEVTIHLINGIKLFEQLTQDAIINFQIWLEKNSLFTANDGSAMTKAHVDYGKEAKENQLHKHSMIDIIK